MSLLLRKNYDCNSTHSTEEHSTFSTPFPWARRGASRSDGPSRSSKDQTIKVWQLADFEVRVVSRLLEPNTSVQDLNLRGNAMGADGVAALQAMPPHGTH